MPTASGTTGPPVHVVWAYPANEATDVPLTFAISVQFDRFLMPSTAARQAMCLQPATVGGEHQGTDRCVQVGFAPQYDPVDRVATWIIRGELTEGTRYNVRLFAPQNEQDPNGVRAFDGAVLEKEFTFAFTTTLDPDHNHGSLEGPRTLGFCQTKQLCPLPDGACDGPMPVPVTTSPRDFLAISCTSGGACHGASGGTPGLSGSALRLDDDGSGGGIAAAVRNLVDHAVVATETATGVDPAAPSRNALAPFGRNMPYIDATNPGNSFLLYKMILAMAPRCPFDVDEESAIPAASACAPATYARWSYSQDFYDCPSVEKAAMARDPLGNCPSDGGFPALPISKQQGKLISPFLEPRVPEDAWRPPARGEYDRLRLRILGSGMPNGGLVSRADALSISGWIADGAKVDTCP